MSIVRLTGHELTPETARCGDDWQVDRCGSRWRRQEEDVGVRGEDGEERGESGSNKKESCTEERRERRRQKERLRGDFSTPARGQQRTNMPCAQHLSLTC